MKFYFLGLALDVGSISTHSTWRPIAYPLDYLYPLGNYPLIWVWINWGWIVYGYGRGLPVASPTATWGHGLGFATMGHHTSVSSCIHTASTMELLQGLCWWSFNCQINWQVPRGELLLSLQCYLRLNDIDLSISNAFEIHVLHQFIVRTNGGHPWMMSDWHHRVDLMYLLAPDV